MTQYDEPYRVRFMRDELQALEEMSEQEKEHYAGRRHRRQARYDKREYDGSQASGES